MTRDAHDHPPTHAHAHDHDHGHAHGNVHGHSLGHSHGHHDHHGHAHAVPADFGRAFAVGTALNLGFVVFEFAYGWHANSLALIADAGHNLGDVLGLLLAWFAATLARRPATATHSYGFRRSPVLAALANAGLMFFAAGAIGAEAVTRLLDPAPVLAPAMMWVAALGVLVNGATAWMFMAGAKRDLNVRGAFLHMATDAAVSLLVVVAGAVILLTGWLWVDPATSLVLVATIAFAAWGLLRSALRLALDGVPEQVDVDGVRHYLGELPQVVGVHHLHIWGLSTTEHALTVHLVVRGGDSATNVVDGNASNALLHTVHDALRERFGIGHATIQLEFEHAEACASEHGHEHAA
jgi:cobalt-zinc-cadmium efflux system protein